MFSGELWVSSMMHVSFILEKVVWWVIAQAARRGLFVTLRPENGDAAVLVEPNKRPLISVRW